MQKIDLTGEQRARILEILRRHVPEREVCVFGSRVGQAPKKFSDLDLVVKGQAALSIETMAALAEEFDESDLPFKVDIVDWATVSEGVRRVIERNQVILQPGSTARAGANEPTGTKPVQRHE